MTIFIFCTKYVYWSPSYLQYEKIYTFSVVGMRKRNASYLANYSLVCSQEWGVGFDLQWWVGIALHCIAAHIAHKPELPSPSCTKSPLALAQQLTQVAHPQRPKNPGSRVELLPGRFSHARKVFCACDINYHMTESKKMS